MAAATGLGNSNNNIPFSWTPTAYQQVHSASAFSNTGAAVFTNMRLRMASGFVNQAGRTIDVEIYLAESPNDAANASATFASNIVSGTEVNVVPRANIVLPQVPDNSWAVAPFPFSNPFVFTGIAHVSWRAIVWGNSNNNTSFTYPLDAWSTAGATAGTGGVVDGCRSLFGGGTQSATHTATGPAAGSNVTFTGNSYVAAGGLPCMLALGTSATDFNGIPLPLDLTPMGAPSCFIWNNWVMTAVGVTNANATGSVGITMLMPNDPGLYGQIFYSQYFFFQATANALGVFASNGRTLTFAIPRDVTRIYAAGNPSGTSGTRGLQFGMAVGFN